jgi:hypothetical protein
MFALTGDRLMLICENWSFCGPCAAGRVKIWKGMGHENFASLNLSLPQEPLREEWQEVETSLELVE